MTVAELNAFVRFTLGGLTVGKLDDATLDMIIQNVLDSDIATSECQEKYYSVRQTLIYLDTNSVSASGDTGAAGAVTERSEQQGDTKITEKYTTDGGGTVTNWGTLLEDFLENPTQYLLCNPFPPVEGGGTGSVVIGGADKNGVEAVYESRNRRDKAAYDYRSPTNFPWRPSRY